MLRPYRALFARPGALAFSAAGVIARVPMSMVGIAIVLVVSTAYGSYGLAGRVSAAMVITVAATGPWIARMVDRLGQARVMRPALATSCVGLVVLSVASASHAHQAWLYAGAVLAGCGGNVGALVRTRWSHALADEPRLIHTAFSLESALDELVFVVGPVLATVLATSAMPLLGFLVPCAAVLAGGAWFVAQRRTEPPPSAHAEGHRGDSLLRRRGVVPLLVAFIGMGLIFGATDVSTVAFATEEGHRAAAGAVLAVFAAGSMTSGFLYGARHWTVSQARRFATAIVLLAAGVCLFLVVGSLGALAGTMFVVGFAISPSIIAGNGLMAEIVPVGRLTEGLSWIGAAITLGASVGAAVAGSRIDAAGSHGGYLFIVVVGVAVVLLVSLAYPALRRAASHANAAAHDEHDVIVEPLPAAADEA